MILTFDFSSDVPLYMQLRNQIVIGIAEGKLVPGEKLPTIRALADESGINMMTVSKAYQILKQEGYLKLDRRHGAVVSVDVDRQRAIEELRTQLREAVARAVCRNVSEKDINAILNEVVEEFR